MVAKDGTGDDGMTERLRRRQEAIRDAVKELNRDKQNLNRVVDRVRQITSATNIATNKMNRGEHGPEEIADRIREHEEANKELGDVIEALCKTRGEYAKSVDAYKGAACEDDAVASTLMIKLLES